MPTEIPIRRSEKLQPQMLTHSSPHTLTFVVEQPYTTSRGANLRRKPAGLPGRKMAFIRRKGNSYYLVHNVRRVAAKCANSISPVLANAPALPMPSSAR